MRTCFRTCVKRPCSFGRVPIPAFGTTPFSCAWRRPFVREIGSLTAPRRDMARENVCQLVCQLGQGDAALRVARLLGLEKVV